MIALPGGGILVGLAVIVLTESVVLLIPSKGFDIVDGVEVAGDNPIDWGGGGGGDLGDTILLFSVNCTGKIRLMATGVIGVTESVVVVVRLVILVVVKVDVGEFIHGVGM